MIGGDFLTEIDPDQSRRQRLTVVGTASWAIGDKACAECRHFEPIKNRKNQLNTAARQLADDNGQRGHCAEYRRLVKGQNWGRALQRLPSIPATTRSCRFFEQAGK